jgi:hypothetical protein
MRQSFSFGIEFPLPKPMLWLLFLVFLKTSQSGAMSAAPRRMMETGEGLEITSTPQAQRKADKGRIQ